MSEDINISITTDKDLIIAGGTVDEQAALGELNNDVLSGVPPLNNDEMPDTPKSSSTNNPPNKDYNYVDTEKVKRYTCPSCKKTYTTTHESMSHIAPVDMEQEEVLKCPHCEVPSVRETLEFTEEIIEARPKRNYTPISREEKRFLCPHCKRAFNTTLETMLTLIPVITEQGELRTCLYCQKASLKTTLESNYDTMFRESPHMPIQANENSSSNINIQPSRQPSSPDQASTGTPSSQILEEIIHTPAIQSITNQYPAFQPSSDEQSASDSNSHQQPTFQSDLYQQPISQPTLHQQQLAFQITLDQISAIQDITNQHPAFQFPFDQQPAFQPSSYEQPASDSNSHQPPAFQSNLNRQSVSQSSFKQQSTFSPTRHQQPAFQSNPFGQPIVRPTLDQQQPAVHPNSNQESTFGPNTDQQLASNPSSRIDPFESFRCRYCGMGFYSFRGLSLHRARGCESRVWYFCPERSCDFYRDEKKGFSQSSNWRRHLRERHKYPHNSGVSQTYRGEVRDPNEPSGWRAL